MTVRRTFDEVLRGYPLAAANRQGQGRQPVNWKQGKGVIIAGSVSDEDAKKI
jgi:alkyl hydroperoxide reductase subunit AhpC